MQIDSARPARSHRLVVQSPNFEARILSGSAPLRAEISGRGALAGIELPAVSVDGPRALAELLAGLEAILGAMRGRGARAAVALALAAAALDS